MESSNGGNAKHDIEKPRKGQKERRSSMAKIALTGIKPTGTPHIGNYLGMIKPALELAQSFQAFYFIGEEDWHIATSYKSCTSC